MMEKEDSAIKEFEKVIDNFTDAIDSHIQSYPLILSILVAQIETYMQKMKKIQKEHGIEMTEKDGKGENVTTIEMPIDKAVLFRGFLSKLSNSSFALETISNNTVVSMVSQYDVFIGNVMRVLFVLKPELLNSSDRIYKASDILEIGDLEEFKDIIVEKEIETVLRQSHIEQLSWFERKLSITLKKFQAYPDFVEIMERRNLFVHTNGVVSRQYVSICKEVKAKIDDVKIGEPLCSGPEYIEHVYRVLFLTGIMLGHIIWNKICPNETDKIIDNLSHIAYTLIKRGKYKVALDVIEFTLTNSLFNKRIMHEQLLIFNINKALSYYLMKEKEKCNQLLDSLDLSGASNEFVLANCVLRDNFDDAEKIMKKFKTNDDKEKLSFKTNFIDWPLFIEFRKTEQFRNAYKFIFDEEYKESVFEKVNLEDVLESANKLIRDGKSCGS